MKRRRHSRIGQVVSKHLFPEDRIVKLADNGTLRKIAERAIRQSRSLGLSVTIVEHGVIYRITPQGERVKIKELQPVKALYKRGHIFSIKAAS